MKRFFLSLTLFCSFFVYSQSKFNSENFTVTRNDLEQNTYQKDSTANALVLYEFGNSFFDKKYFVLKTEEQHKIKKHLFI